MSHSTKGRDAAGRTERLNKSEFHWLFAESRCRTTLEALDELTLPVDVEELAIAVATIEPDRDAEEREDVDDIAASLHHVHLPKMDRLGVVHYDPERNTVSDPAGMNPEV